MALKGTTAQRLMTLAMIVGAELLLALPLALQLSTPAAAQFFPFFSNEPRRPQPPGGFQLFGPAPVQEAPKAPPVDYSRAPSPKKPEAPPTTTVVVMGDSMADWLSYGLEDAVTDMPGVGIVRKHKTYSGLVRYESRGDQDWPHVARDMLNTEKPAVIVMMLGVNDRQAIREQPPARGAPPPMQDQPTPGSENPDLQIMAPEPPRSGKGIAEFRSDRWKDLYVKRIDDTIASLKSKGVPVIWVGLPPVRIAKAMADNIYLNDLYRSRAEKAGIIYVDVWDGFVDEAGKYSPQGPDVEGQIRRLRAPDGVHFTKAGARKLAHYVEREISRIMSGRSVPVAFPTDEAVQPAPSATLRPGIPAARPLAGPVVPLNLNNVSTTEALLGGGSGARPAAADPVATRVLIKGEPVAAPRGRADDFGWPSRRGAAAPSTPDKASPQAAISAPEQPAPVASRPVQERDAGKKPALEPVAQAPSNPAPKKPKPPATVARENPRPPASVGANNGNGFVPFGWLR